MIDLATLRTEMQKHSIAVLAKETGLSPIILRRIRNGLETEVRQATVGLIYRACKDHRIKRHEISKQEIIDHSGPPPEGAEFVDTLNHFWKESDAGELLLHKYVTGGNSAWIQEEPTSELIPL